MHWDILRAYPGYIPVVFSGEPGQSGNTLFAGATFDTYDEAVVDAKVAYECLADIVEILPE
jgi:hypothetical protein